MFSKKPYDVFEATLRLSLFAVILTASNFYGCAASKRGGAGILASVRRLIDPTFGFADNFAVPVIRFFQVKFVLLQCAALYVRCLVFPGYLSPCFIRFLKFIVSFTPYCLYFA